MAPVSAEDVRAIAAGHCWLVSVSADRQKVSRPAPPGHRPFNNLD